MLLTAPATSNSTRFLWIRATGIPTAPPPIWTTTSGSMANTQRGLWTWDDVTSRCIDAGNPNSPLGDELLTIPADPNGQWGQNIRINMGAFGGTEQASIPPLGWAIPTASPTSPISLYGPRITGTWPQNRPPSLIQPQPSTPSIWPFSQTAGSTGQPGLELCSRRQRHGTPILRTGPLVPIFTLS